MTEKQHKTLEKVISLKKDSNKLLEIQIKWALGVI